MIKEKITKSVGSLFRTLPEMRGKNLLGRKLQKLIMKDYEWKKPEIWMKMKGGFEIFADARSGPGLKAMYTGTYDSALIDQFCDLFESDWVILDIGANVGFYAVPLGMKMKTLGGKVYAFEPVSTNYNSLVKSIKRNGLEDTIYPINTGLGEKNEEVEIMMEKHFVSGNAVIRKEGMDQINNYESKEVIQIHRLDDYLDQIHRCDFIKMDVEGYEIFALRGAAEFIKKNKPIIYGEFGWYYMEKFNVSLKEGLDFFEALGYSAYKQIMDGNRKKTRFKLIDKAHERMGDLLFIPPDANLEKLKNILDV